MDISLISAFIGGILALLSPCAALLLPAFFGSTVGAGSEAVPRDCPDSSSPRSGRRSSSSSSHLSLCSSKGRWLYGVVAFFCLFHLMTYLALGIHFLPTVICWAAFLPLEKLVPKRFAAPRALA
jgi:cytochrome c biogenesis protein CcdA